MKVIDVPITQIKPYENNPRRNADAVDQTAESIDKYGWQQPIVVDKNYVIVAGHTSYLAAKKLGYETVPIKVADELTEAQAAAYRLVDNKTGELAKWDQTKLDEELRRLADEYDVDMTLFGFLADEVPQIAEEDDFDPRPPKVPKSKYGQIYQLGRHRIMCGDSTKLEDVQRLMDGKNADMLLTDPPYNVDYESKAGKIKNDSMSPEQFRQFLSEAFRCADAVMEPGAAFYIWHADGEPAYEFRASCRDVGWKIRQCLVWVKDKFVLSRQDYHWRHEPCLYGEKPDTEECGDESEPCMYGWKDGKHRFFRNRKQNTVLEFDRPKHSREHPTMKPIPLFAYQIESNTHQGEIVLDLFGGSGTTVMACEQNGRSAYVMELDPRFVDVIINRWEAYTGMHTVLLE